MKRVLLLLTLVASLVVSAATVSAHPGRTDSNGGHTCRTNCEQYGLDYGEYHYHNGGGSTTPAPAPAPKPAPRPAVAPTPAPAPEPAKPKTAKAIADRLNSEGQKKGVIWADLILDSHKGKKTSSKYKRVNAATAAKLRAAKAATSDKKIGNNTFHLVSAVVDGDTIKLDVNGKRETVRLLAIDTPETKDPRKPVQCFGKEATAKMLALVNGKQVRLEADNSQPDRDRYGRLLRYLYLEDGTNVNAEMVKQGYAFAYTRYPVNQLDQMRQLEKKAREGNRGLWGSCQ